MNYNMSAGLALRNQDYDKMPGDFPRKLDEIDTASTARIDRRHSVLAQIEAALLADKLSVLEISEESTGQDPYNSFRASASPRARRAR